MTFDNAKSFLWKLGKNLTYVRRRRGSPRNLICPCMRLKVKNIPSFSFFFSPPFPKKKITEKLFTLHFGLVISTKPFFFSKISFYFNDNVSFLINGVFMNFSNERILDRQFCLTKPRERVLINIPSSIYVCIYIYFNLLNTLIVKPFKCRFLLVKSHMVIIQSLILLNAMQIRL